MKPRLLLIDNYDSFTYNLVQAFEALGAEVLVFRNDQISTAEARRLEPSHLVISPGPGRPDQAGVSVAMIQVFLTKLPILGVCLGHQSLVEALGGEIVLAKTLMHGKTSLAQHDEQTLFSGLTNPLEVGRYHSLAALRTTLPDELSISAETPDGEIMAVRHKELPVEGVQFHPESVLTPEGDALMNNFLKQ